MTYRSLPGRSLLECSASLILLLAKIILCLMLAGYDRAMGARRGYREAPDMRPRALEGS